MSDDNNNNNDVDFEDDNDDGLWWWSPEAYAVKFAIIVALFAVVAVYLLGGYLHAKRRIRKGLPPLAYHRWMLSRAERARFDPNYHPPQIALYQVPEGYATHGYPAPPPAYNPNAPPPPTYQPPEGGSKIAPSQSVYQPPQGSPPSSSDAIPPAENNVQTSSSRGFLSRFKRN